VISILSFITELGPSSVGENTVAGIDWAEPYLYLNVSVNVTFTVLIVARLLLHKRHIQTTAGSQYAVDYMGVSAMLIESSMMYSVVALLFAILLARGSSAAALFLPAVPHTQVRVRLPLPLHEHNVAL
jgi:hypothetical protein